jgi:hypothetical protein
LGYSVGWESTPCTNSCCTPKRYHCTNTEDDIQSHITGTSLCCNCSMGTWYVESSPTPIFHENRYIDSYLEPEMLHADMVQPSLLTPRTRPILRTRQALLITLLPIPTPRLRIPSTRIHNVRLINSLIIISRCSLISAIQNHSTPKPQNKTQRRKEGKRGRGRVTYLAAQHYPQCRRRWGLRQKHYQTAPE